MNTAPTFSVPILGMSDAVRQWRTVDVDLYGIFNNM